MNGSVTIAKNHITLSKQVYSFPTNRYNQTSEFARKRGGTGKLDFLKNSQNKENHFDQIDLIGYSQFNEFNEYYYDSEIEEEVGFKIEETQNSIEQIINKKFTELNIQEQVDDMIIECMTDLGMNYEEAYTELEKYFNLPLVSDIINGKSMITDFYKKEISFMDPIITGYKRPKIEFSQTSSESTENIGREKWIPSSLQYEGESQYKGKGTRMPIGKLYSKDMLKAGH